MKFRSVYFALLLTALATTQAAAVDLGLLFACHSCYWPQCIQQTCCDDYCPKPEPCVPKVSRFGCDDYRPKCEPCTPPVRCFGCDDYCPKCAPVIRCRPTPDLKCVPTGPLFSACDCGKCKKCSRHKK
jgi:hypothetical protein